MGIVTIEACCQTTEVLEFIEAAFNAVTLFLEFFVIKMWAPSVGARRNNGLDIFTLQVAP